MRNKIILNTGDRFGKWTVLSISKDNKACCYWDCACDCGNIKSVASRSLRKGLSKSCGRCSDTLVGSKFNRWKVLSFAFVKGHNKYWNCQCDCGELKTIAAYSLKSNGSKSCGCLLKEVVSLPEGKAAMNVIHRNYTRTANDRNLEFTLTTEEFEKLTSSNCYYCNRSPNQKINKPRSNGNYIYNGIDRMDNEKGYTNKNCVPCCKFCNQAKSDQPKEEFLKWIKQIYDHCFVNQEQNLFLTNSKKQSIKKETIERTIK